MTEKPESKSTIAAAHLLLVCTVILLGALLYNHYRMITFAAPLDYNEAGMLSATAIIAEGKNPYTFENQPIYTVVYPVLYNMIVAPLTPMFGNTLLLHRVVAGLFILLSCGICYLVARRQGNSPVEGLAVFTLWYAVLLYYSTPISSPNSLGVFLFIASICTPWLFHFSRRSLCAAMVFGILAFYAKQYQIACLGFIALYLFITVSKKSAVLFGIASLLLFLLSLGLVTYTSPYFLDNTVFAVSYIAALVSTYKSLSAQLIAFLQYYAPLFVILVIEAFYSLIGNHGVTAHETKGTPDRRKMRRFDLTDMKAPLCNVEVNYFWFCLACSTLVIVFVLGKNPANHLTYLFQIMSPFFLLACFQLVARSEARKPLYYLLIVATFYLNYSLLPRDFSIDSGNWDKLKQAMAGADEIFGSTLVLPEIIQSGKKVYENGHTRYFYYAEEKPPYFAHGKPEEDITQMWTRYVNRINAMIAAQEFDVILLDQWMLLPKPSPRSNITVDAQALLRKHYYLSDRVMLNLANRPGGGVYDIQVWKPKRKTADGHEPVQH